MALLPALGLVTLFRLVTRRRIHWAMLIAVGLPAALLLAYQTIIWNTGRDSQILFQPLGVFYEWTLHYEAAANQGLFVKLLASIAFPLLTTLLMWRQARRSVAVQLAWLCTAIGLTYSYLLVDTAQVAAGDFIWTAQISLLVLFMATLLLLVQGWSQLRGWQRWPQLGMLALHVFAGIVWYNVHLTSTYMDLIYRWW